MLDKDVVANALDQLIETKYSDAQLNRYLRDRLNGKFYGWDFLSHLNTLWGTTFRCYGDENSFVIETDHFVCSAVCYGPDSRYLATVVDVNDLSVGEDEVSSIWKVLSVSAATEFAAVLMESGEAPQSLDEIVSFTKDTMMMSAASFLCTLESVDEILSALFTVLSLIDIL